MFRSAVLALCLFSHFAIAELSDQLRATVRFHSSRSQDSFIDETAYYRRQFNPWLNSEFGVRLIQNFGELLRGLDYKGELFAYPVPFFSVGTRLAHRNFLPESASVTQFLFSANLEGKVFSFFEPFASFGYYVRLPLLTKATIIPTFRSSYIEKHFAFQLGFRIYPSDNIILSTRLATYDEMDVFNLQNPYFQGDFEYLLAGEAIAAMVQFRYQLLLGFGRMDEWMVGVGLRLKLFRELPDVETIHEDREL